MKFLKGVINRYFDYDIVESYLAYDHGKYIKKYIKRYRLKKRG